MMDSQRGSILASLCGIEGIVTNSIQNNNNKIFKGKIKYIKTNKIFGFL
jgi:hypothetical protein